MKNYLYAVLIFIIIGLIYLKLNASNDVSAPSPSALNIVQSSPTPSPVAMKPLITEYFSLEYPASATAPAVLNHPDSIEWRVIQMGDIQKASGRTQTELSDGYLLSITRFEVPSSSSSSAQIQAEADRQGTIDTCGEDNVTDIDSSSRVGSYSAISYFGGCLGEATHYYLTDKTSLYRLSALVAGSEDNLPIYNNSIQSIFASFKLFN